METWNEHSEENHFQINHQMKFIVDSVPFHLLYLNPDEKFLFVNAAAAEFWGLEVEQMIGKTIQDIIIPETYSNIKQYIDRAQRGEEVTFEYPFVKPDKSVCYFLLSIIPDFNLNGKIIGFITTALDITIRRKALDEAKKLANDFRTLADSMPQIVWTANPDGHVDYYNRRWYEYTDLPDQSTGNSLWEHLIHPDDFKMLHLIWTQAINTGIPYEIEFRIKNAKSGEYRWFLVRATPARDDSGNILKWYGTSTDIHDQKILLNNLKLEQDLREKFISTLSHDLRTPLSVAKVSAQLIIKKHRVPAIEKLSSRIVENMCRADRMIQDLLDVNLIKSGHQPSLNAKECDLVEISKRVLDEFAIVHGDRFLLVCPEYLFGKWDSERLRRILENLLTNAVKYGLSGSKIRVEIEQYDETAVLRVINLGNPIPLEDIPGMFDLYKRAESTRGLEGWGLGLSLVKGLAEAHGGSINVTSSYEEGTSFIVSLPCTTFTDYK